MEKSKKDGKVILGIVIAVMVILGLFAGALIGLGIRQYRSYMAEVAEVKFKSEQKQLLKEQLEKVTVLNPLTDEVDQTIYTEKEYAEVEKAMKAYFTDLFSIAKTVNGFSKDKRFAILSDQEQVIEDAPKFQKSLTAIETLKSEYTKEIDELAAFLTDEKIKSYLDAGVGEEYVTLYNEMMINDTTMLAEKDLQKQMAETKDAFVELLDQYDTLLKYLVSVEDSWKIEGTVFMFSDQKKLDKYNQYVDELNSKINEMNANELL